MKKLLMLIATMIICDAYGETVYWMADNSLSAVSECEYDGNITIPADPYKPGFRLIGWAEGDIDSFIAKYVTTNPTSSTPASTGSTDNSWSVTASWGSMYGKAMCSSLSGPNNCFLTSAGVPPCTKNSNPPTTDPSPDNSTINYSGNTDRYCWCKLTRIINSNVSSMAWVYATDATTANKCSTGCTEVCARYAKNYYKWRSAILGVDSF